MVSTSSKTLETPKILKIYSYNLDLQKNYQILPETCQNFHCFGGKFEVSLHYGCDHGN